MPPVKPMLAKLAREMPAPAGMLFEPKWDGFRCIVFRDGEEVELEPYRAGALDGHPWEAWAEAEAEAEAAAKGGRMHGGQSCWNAGRNVSWEPLRPELVAEVAFDHLQGDRFRHATSFVRWRPEREPASCTYGQLDVAVPEELESVFRA